MIEGIPERHWILGDIGGDPTWVRVTGELSIIGSDVREFNEIESFELAEKQRHLPFFTYEIVPVAVEFLTETQFTRAMENESND